MTPHAGEKVKEYLKASGMSVSEFARRLNCHRQNVYDIFKRQDIDLPGSVSSSVSGLGFR